MVYPHSYRQKNSETITTSSLYGAYYARSQSLKIKIQPELLRLLQWVDTFRPKQEEDLKEMVEIPSITESIAHRDDIIRMMKLTQRWLVKLGIKNEAFNVGYHTIDGQKFRIPPVVLGQIGFDKHKYTVCVYGHLDVADPTHQEGWLSDPFEFTRRDKCYFGAGIGTSKAPLMMWMHVVQAFRETKTELPVNLRFIIESMGEQNNEGLEQLLRTQAIGLLKGVDFLVVADSNWIGKNLPCLTYGAVGYCHFWLTSEKVNGSSTDPREDLEIIAASMLGERDTILIDDHDACVEHITPDEEMMFEQIQDFDVRDIRSVLPDYKKNWDKVKVLMNFWRMPGLQINEIEECTCDKKDKTPKKLKLTYMYKVVPHQIPDGLAATVDRHIRKVVAAKKITNKIVNKMVLGQRPWLEDLRHAHYEAAKRATIQIYKEVPSMIREDREMPILQVFKRVFNKNILVLPLFNTTVNFRRPNENISERNYFEGTKLLAAYLIQISYIQPPDSGDKK